MSRNSARTPGSGFLQAVRDCQPGAAEALVEDYQRVVYAVCLRVAGDEHLAADAAQQTFVNLLRHAAGQASLPATRDEEGWFVRCAARNTTLHLRAKQQRFRDRHAPEQLDPPAPRLPPPEETAEEARLLRAKVGELAEPHRVVVSLRFFFFFSYAHLAEALFLPGGTIKSRMAAALQELRRRLEPRGDRP